MAASMARHGARTLRVAVFSPATHLETTRRRGFLTASCTPPMHSPADESLRVDSV
jgi:hypothetical protein